MARTPKKAQPKKRDPFSKLWIIANSIEIISRYAKGVLTIRALHYQLVSIGMTNTTRHYKRVVDAMTEARWSGQVSFYAFSDHDRPTIGETDFDVTDVDDEIDNAKDAIGRWVRYYSKNRWENQPVYPEVWIEKKALQGVFNRPCQSNSVRLAPCKGYPSLTFLNQAKDRFVDAIEKGKRPVILYFGDYDPSGEDIPRSIADNLERLGVYDLEVKRIALMQEQVEEWNLPPAPARIDST